MLTLIIEATLRRVVAHAGDVIDAPHLDSADGAWIATFRDLAGNVIGLYQEGLR